MKPKGNWAPRGSAWQGQEEGTAELRGWLYKLAPVQKKTSFFREPQRGLRQQHGLRVKARKQE